MDAAGLPHRDKENTGPVLAHDEALRSAFAVAEPRSAFQEQGATNNIKADAAGHATGGYHSKFEVRQAASGSALAEACHEAETGSRRAGACSDEDLGDPSWTAPAVEGSTVSTTTSNHLAELQRLPAPAAKPVFASAKLRITAAQMAHPAGMRDAFTSVETSRCYTEVLQLVKPKPENAQHNGPLWRLPGPAFGAMQRSAGQGNGAKGKDTHSLAAQREGLTEIRKMAASRPSKLPPARTYAEMAKRQRGIKAASDQGGLRQGIPNSGSAMPNPSSAPKTNKIASAVEKTNMAALRALDNSKLVPAGHARKRQTQPVRENSSRAAVDTRYVPPAALKRPLSRPSTALRNGNANAKGEEAQDGEAHKRTAAAVKPRAPFRPGGSAPMRSIKPSAMADLDANYTIAHKQMQQTLQRESKMAEEKVKAAECDVACAINKQHKIEKALEEQSERSSHERKVMRILLSSEHTLEEMERAASISAVRSVSGQSISSLHELPTAHCTVAAGSPPSAKAAPFEGLEPVPEESPALAQVYDMSVMRATRRQPCRQLLKDVLQPKPMSERMRGTCEELFCRTSGLPQGPIASGEAAVMHASIGSAFQRQSVGHNPLFGKTLYAQAQDSNKTGDDLGSGHPRMNPAFEPSDSSSLLQPDDQNTIPGLAESQQDSAPYDAKELSPAAYGALFPSQIPSLADQEAAQGSGKGPQQKLPQGKHQRGGALPTSASLGRLTVPSSAQDLPQSSSEPSVTGPCPELPSHLRQLADLRSGSVSGPHASSSARNSSTSNTTASASHAAPSAACQDILAQQSKTAVEGDAGQGAHSTSNTAQHAEASQLEASGRMPFTSRVHLHSQVLCEDLHDEESPIPRNPQPWGEKEDRGVFSSTLSFLDKVRPSERFSPLENSLGTPKAHPQAVQQDYPLCSASREGGDSTLPCGGPKPNPQRPKISFGKRIRAAVIHFCCRAPCSSLKASTCMSRKDKVTVHAPPGRS